MLDLRLSQPLAFIDIESTGVSPRADRIIDLCIVKVMPDGSRMMHEFRLNPGIPIPPEATRIHGITDADVADRPAFRQVAAEIDGLLKGCDLAGYNVVRYDVPMLVEEFARAGIRFDVDGRGILDVQRIYHRREPRDLSAALAFYCGTMHTNAHGAAADVEATIRVLQAQLRRYPDLPRDMAGLHDYCNPRDPSWVDRTGRLRWKDGDVVLNFGRNKGEPLRRLIEKDPNFVKWMLRSDFPRDTREIVENATKGLWPRRDRDARETGGSDAAARPAADA